MKDIYLTNYSVNGIKTLDKTVSLSFYKKTINKEPDTQEYNEWVWKIGDRDFCGNFAQSYH